MSNHRRNLKFFLFGILIIILLSILFNWNDFKKGFSDGLNDSNSSVEETK